MPGRLMQKLALLGSPPARVMVPRPLSADNKTVTVVVPCYSYGHYLQQCVDTVLTQRDVRPDVIIVDDASPDGSGEVAAKLAADDSRIRVIQHHRNTGHITTYNDGLAAATGDYVVLLSADDALTPGALGRAVALMEAEPGVGFVYGWAQNCTDDPLPMARTRVGSWTIWPGEQWIKARCRTASNSIRCPEVVMRTAVQREIGGYRADLPHSGDFEMWMRAAAVADVGLIGGVDQAYYRLHGRNMSRTTYASTLTNLVERRRAIDCVFDVMGARLRHADEFRAMARKALAVEALQHASAAVIRRGSDGDSPEGYRDFARGCWPSIVSTQRWRRLDLQGNHLRQAATRAAFRLDELNRDLRGRLHWHRRHWSGV